MSGLAGAIPRAGGAGNGADAGGDARAADAGAAEPPSAFAHGPGFSVPYLAGVTLGERVFPKHERTTPDGAPDLRKAAIYRGPVLPSPRGAGQLVETVVKVAARRHEPSFPIEVALQMRASAFPGVRGRSWLAPAVLAVAYTDSFAYLVMEAVKGETLADKLEDGPAWALSETQGPKRNRSLAAEVRAAVGALARAGIAFLDRTPYNFMWGAVGGAGEPHIVVIDYGNAREATPERAAEEAEGGLLNEDFK